MAKPDGLVAAQALGSEPVQQVHLSLSHVQGKTKQQRRSKTRTRTPFCPGSTPHLFQDPEKVVRPLGSRGESRVHTDERVVAEGRLVNVVKRADFLVRRVFPGEGRIESVVTGAAESSDYSTV